MPHRFYLTRSAERRRRAAERRNRPRERKNKAADRQNGSAEQRDKSASRKTRPRRRKTVLRNGKTDRRSGKTMRRAGVDAFRRRRNGEFQAEVPVLRCKDERSGLAPFWRRFGRQFGPGELIFGQSRVRSVRRGSVSPHRGNSSAPPRPRDAPNLQWQHGGTVAAAAALGVSWAAFLMPRAWSCSGKCARRCGHGEGPERFLLLEHPHVYTLGARSEADLLAPPSGAPARIEVPCCDRAGRSLPARAARGLSDRQPEPDRRRVSALACATQGIDVRMLEEEEALRPSPWRSASPLPAAAPPAQ